MLQNKLVANAGTDREIQVNTPVQLDGSGSSDGNQLPFTYHWTFKSRPANSTAALTNHTQEKPGFTPDQLGLYEVELKIANQTGEKTATVKLTAVAGAPASNVINQDITQDRVLEDINEDPNVPDYIVTADIAVKAKLTVMPGVVIAFEDKKGLHINQSGALIAKGTAEKKVVFTGKQATKGYWSGIAFTNNNPLNELLHVEINYAGSHPIHPMPQATAIGVSELSFLKLSHTAIQHSSSNGLWVRNSGIIQFSNNVFRHNESINITLPVKEAHKLDSESIIEAKNETVNYVELLGSEIEEDVEIVWKKLQNNVKYRIKGDMVIKSALTIEKGVKIGVAPDKYIRVITDGSLMAKGSSDEPIVFDVFPAGTQKWRGLVVSSSKYVNRLEWVEIKNAGNGQAGSGVDKSAAIGVSNVHGNIIHLKHVKIQDSDGYGVFVHQAGMLGEFDQVTFSGIKNHVMALPISNVRGIQESQITTSNNLKNSIEVFEGNINLTGETLWGPLSGGVTYYLPKSMQVLSGSGLRLLPGTKIEFGQDALLTINSGAFFTSVGTPELPVELKGEGDQRGYWTGILIKSNSLKNIIRYSVISGGGSQPMPGLGHGRANIAVTAGTSASLNITYSKIEKGSGWGIIVESNFGAKLNGDANTINEFEDMTLGAVIRL
ncbi:PKD domain containing protein [Indibacter alkaliphilus LW1]|uniref:PKD domain containing protein n=1 Tax=Indibacter alkaliphilus (strain CCUG 57479 / KCTC 22604 / LW1) TaxID=1189612 RepID=S2DNE4_INDAL|nr:PKD domain containing protein [Indibacter alkaliphilus LW1]